MNRTPFACRSRTTNCPIDPFAPVTRIMVCSDRDGARRFFDSASGTYTSSIFTVNVLCRGIMSKEQELGLRERKKRETRRALAEAATRLFAEHGFDEVTVADVAAAANVAQKT